jgi:phosphate transport system permease protein
MFKDMRKWFGTGEPFVWLNAGAVGISIVMVVGLTLLIAVRGLGHFWPHAVYEFQYLDQGNPITVIGQIHGSEVVDTQRLIEAGYQLPGYELEEATRYLIKVGNRDVYALDFRTLVEPRIQSQERPEELVTVERREYGQFFGYLREVKQDGTVVARGAEAWDEFQARIERATELYGQIKVIEKGEIGAINYRIERLRLKGRGLELDGVTDPAPFAEIEAQRNALNEEFVVVQRDLQDLYTQLARDSYVIEIQDGRLVELPLGQVVRAFKPNAMGLPTQVLHYIAKVWEFVSDDPREANTEGGIFPAIFGTVVMVLVMSVIVSPFGVVAAVYLREYAKQGPLVRTIRIAVNNLAGVPSIVYGVFGLGFFVYFLGGSIDQLFFPAALPSPTFGAPGLLWASLTLALLTLPVVIVSTEEGLARIPSAIREGSLALGATKAETLWRTVLPMASPAMMTGLILAVARAAGEVAPLMLVGVVKLAPALPVDGNFPFVHLDRRFMHLGFHIYDVGFQSPNVEAARPLVYATALLLVLVIIVLNLTAIQIRNHLREKYRALET